MLSPIGVLYISIYPYFCSNKSNIRFRPLLGFFIFLSDQCRQDKKYVGISVPYWGSLYFNYSSSRLSYIYRVSVPYWGSIYFNTVTALPLTDRVQFPSPIGVLYISIFAQNFCKFYGKISVPDWGSLYFNK